jgi:hypothetical protein
LEAETGRETLHEVDTANTNAADKPVNKYPRLNIFIDLAER